MVLKPIPENHNTVKESEGIKMLNNNYYSFWNSVNYKVLIKIISTVDSIGIRRQLGVHMEPSIKGDCTEVVWTHGYSSLHGLPPHRKHYRFGRP